MTRSSHACCVVVLLVLALSSVALGASAQAPPSSELRDRVAFGGDVHVAPGEVVRDAVAFGGDTIVEGEVRGDAVAFGGSVVTRSAGVVRGDVASFGASMGQLVGRGHHAGSHGLWHWLTDVLRSAAFHALVFLLGLLLLGAARERMRTMQATMVKKCAETAGVGLLTYLVSGTAMAVLAVTIVGIPVAVVIGLALPVVTFVGLAATATVIGALLPLPQWRAENERASRDVERLAAGVLVLFVASIVPFAGTFATAIAACLGLGALVRTCFGKVPLRDVGESGAGPYRAPAGG